MPDPTTDHAALKASLSEAIQGNLRLDEQYEALGDLDTLFARVASLKAELDESEKRWAGRHLEEQRAAMRMVERAEARAVRAETALREAEEAFATVEAVAARAVQAETALRKYADPTNWGIEREEFRYPRCVWIGPGATQRPPDATKIAREALAVSSASEAETERGTTPPAKGPVTSGLEPPASGAAEYGTGTPQAPRSVSASGLSASGETPTQEETP